MNRVNDRTASKLVEDLEYKELENSNCEFSESDYSELLALYIYQNDMNNAKYLWKRIPNAIKVNSEELNAIWEIGKLIYKRQFDNIYEKFNAFPWSQKNNVTMMATKGKLREQMCELISVAYSAIDSEKVYKLSGKTRSDLNWPETVDVNLNKVILNPVREIEDLSLKMSQEEQFEKITKYILFLEDQ